MKKLLFVMMAILMVNVTTYAAVDMADELGNVDTDCSAINGSAAGDSLDASEDAAGRPAGSSTTSA